MHTLMLQRKKLLLVEGDAIVLSALCELLMPDDKFHLTTATSCGDAEFLFKDTHFDLIINAIGAYDQSNDVLSVDHFRSMISSNFGILIN